LDFQLKKLLGKKSFSREHEALKIHGRPTFRSLNREWLPKPVYIAEMALTSALQNRFGSHSRFKLRNVGEKEKMEG
jgi:hypothetical protein